MAGTAELIAGEPMTPEQTAILELGRRVAELERRDAERERAMRRANSEIKKLMRAHLDRIGE